MSRINVLITGGGAPGAPGIIKCLLQDERINLYVADADENAIGKYLHPQFHTIPPASDPNFVESLFDFCKNRNIQFVLPLVTKELLPLAKAKETFRKQGIVILVSDPDSISLANNKSACYQYLQKHDVNIPAFHIVKNIEEFEQAALSLGYPEKTFCFKPSVSNGSRGFRIISDNLDLNDILFNQKPTNTYLTYEYAIQLLSQKPFPELLVCEYLPGEEYSIDCLAENGVLKIALPRLRQKMNNGISVKGEFQNDKAIIDYCNTIITILKLHGNIGIQLKRNIDGEALLLEINPRVQGSIVAGLGAGVNLPLLAIHQELGMSIELNKLNIRWGTSFSRYWTEVFH